MSDKQVRLRSHAISYVFVLLMLIFLAPFDAQAGPLNAPSAPGATQSYTFEDLYQRLNAGTTGAQSGFTEPAAGPTLGTMHSVNDIMSKAPSVDDTDGATAAQVLSGKTFWGLRSGAWGALSGTMATRMLSATSTTVEEGYYAATTLNLVDADLTADNIKKGVTLFGVGGAYEGVESSSTAAVPQTGQTTPYAAGDDGDLKKGVAWPVPRFTDNGDGTVTDHLTGLMWLKKANYISTDHPGFDNDFTVGDGRVTWPQTLAQLPQKGTLQVDLKSQR